MAKAKVVGINILALNSQLDSIVNFLQKEGVVELCTITHKNLSFNPVEYKDTLTELSTDIKIVEKAMGIIKEYCGVNENTFFLNNKKRISQSQFFAVKERRNTLLEMCHRLIKSVESIKENNNKISNLDNEITYLNEWTSLDIPLDKRKTENLNIFIGRIDNGEISAGFPYIKETVKNYKNSSNVVFACLKENANELKKFLQGLNFRQIEINSSMTAIQLIKNCKSQIEKHNEDNKYNFNYISYCSQSYDSLRLLYEYLNSQITSYNSRSKILNSDYTSAISGYVDEKNYDYLQNSLNKKFNAYCESFVPETPPVILENNSFASPVETVLETYSMPSKNEIDPTPYMSVFYYLFFGMMFSDAGYGLVMSSVCGFVLLKYKDISRSLKKNLMMFFFCGLSTIFWGIMFGSFFGDAVNVISQTFFGIDNLVVPGLTAAVWFNPVDAPMRLLLLSFLFGIIHIFVGLILKAVMLYKRKKYMDIIYDVVSWILLVSGGILALMSTSVFYGIGGFVLPEFFITIGGFMALIGALLILVFSGRGSTAIKRALKGAYGLYGITTYLSDILSYSRLLALGLATGVIAQVFNQIGAMLSGGILGAVLFIIVFIIGHSLNIGINALGAYVHTNRLQFVEFFGKFYSGGGRKFKPLSYNSNYFVITEN